MFELIHEPLYKLLFGAILGANLAVLLGVWWLLGGTPADFREFAASLALGSAFLATAEFVVFSWLRARRAGHSLRLSFVEWSVLCVFAVGTAATWLTGEKRPSDQARQQQADAEAQAHRKFEQSHPELRELREVGADAMMQRLRNSTRPAR